MSLARRFLFGSGLSLVDQVLKIASAFILTPIIVNGLGADLYGAWSLLIAVFAQYGWLDLGLAVSMPRFFAKAISSKEPGAIRSLASTGAGIFLCVAVISAAVTVVVAWLAPAWFEAPKAAEVARSVVIVFGTFLAVQTTAQLSLGYLKGHLRYDKIALASIIRVTLTSVLFVICIQRGWGLLGISLIHAGCGILECAMLTMFSRGLQPPLTANLREFDKTRARELLGFSAAAFVINASANLRSTFQPIIIASQISEAAVTDYSLGSRFPILFVDLAHIVAGGQLIALFSRLAGPAHLEDLKRAFVFACRMCAAMAVLGAGMMWMFGLPFLQRWIPAHALEAWSVLMPSVLPKALFVAQTPSMAVLFALARHKRLAVWDWVGGLCNVALTWWLCAQVGAAGAGWATCIEQSLICAFVWPMFAARALGLTFSEVCGGLLVWPVLRAALILAPCTLLLRYAQPDYLILTAIGLTSCAWFSVASIFTMGTEEKTWLLKLMPFLARFGIKGGATANDAS